MAVCPCSVEALAEAWRRVGTEFGSGPRVSTPDMGTGREAFSGEGREVFNVAGGFRVLFKLLGLLSGVSSIFSVLLFTTQEEEEPP